MKRICLLALTISVLLFFTSTLVLAFGGMGQPQQPTKSAPSLPAGFTIQVRIPMFSPYAASTPLATVDGQPIRLGEVVAGLGQDWSEKPLAKGAPGLNKAFEQVLDQMISARSQGNGDAEIRTFTKSAISADKTLLIEVPIFSQHFMFTPVAVVNEEPIPMGEFAKELGARHAESEKPTVGGHQPDNPASLLERLIIVRLVEQEARNMGLNQQGMVKRQINDFSEKTLLYELLGRQIENMPLDRKEVDKVYRDISLSARLEDYRIPQQSDADALREALAEGKDFDVLIAEAVEAGKAIPGEEDDFILFKNLLSKIASTAHGMEEGDVSPVFRVSNGFAIFRLLEKKFVEDPAALEMAEKIVWDEQVAAKTKQYFQSIINQHATFDEQARKDLNFSRIKENSPDINMTEALADFQEDQRILVTVKAGEKTRTLKVSEAIDKLEKMYFHGTDVVLNAQEADERLSNIINDWIFRIAGKFEAQKLGLDRSLEYVQKVQDFERRTLFDHFMQKVVIPDVKLTEEDIRQDYDSHPEEFSTPAMLKLETLAFEEQENAQDALKKLQKGSDFKWVSANVEGLVPADDPLRLDFESGILSLTSLPKIFQENAEDLETGDAMLYSDPDSYHYVVYFEKIYPPEPKPYEQVRSQILDDLYQERVKETLMNYVDQLKKHYPTKAYLETQAS